jgi:hypothetical protein
MGRADALVTPIPATITEAPSAFHDELRHEM